MATLYRTFALALVLFGAVAVRAGEVPRFIESVIVEGARDSVGGIIVGESKLVPGMPYTEAELHAAMRRINRLPFVVHTDFRLARGSVRDRYVLIVSVTEAKPWFATLTYVRSDHDIREPVAMVRDFESGDLVPLVSRSVAGHEHEHAAIGVRAFIGASGMVHASIDTRGDGLGGTLGYTRYRLFGSRATASLLLTYREPEVELPPRRLHPEGDPSLSLGDRLDWQATVALPLAGNHALRLAYARQTFPYVYHQTDLLRDPNGVLTVVRLNSDDLELAWVYDSTDDPLLPFEGSRARVGTAVRREIHFVPGPTGFTYDLEQRNVTDLDAGVSRSWPMSRTSSLFASVDAQLLGDARVRRSTVRAGGVRRLRTPDESAGNGEIRLEIEQTLYGGAHAPSNSTTARATVGFRNRWGVARVGIAYDWGGRP